MSGLFASRSTTAFFLNGEAQVKLSLTAVVGLSLERMRGTSVSVLRGECDSETTYISSITIWLVVTFIWEMPAGERRNIGALIGRETPPSRFLEPPVAPSSPMHTSLLRKSCRRTTSRHAAIALWYNAVRMTMTLKKLGSTHATVAAGTVAMLH